jgi:hypothetical protein
MDDRRPADKRILPGSGPTFADSPMSRIWKNADDTHARGAEAVARMLRERRADPAPTRGRFWSRGKR